MSPLIVDGPFGDRLLAANNVTEVHDASGKLLGKFVPTPCPSFTSSTAHYPRMRIWPVGCGKREATRQKR